MIPVKITAIANYLPEKIATSEDIVRQFEREFGENHSSRSLERLLGTREHRVASPQEEPSDLLARVAKKILKESGISGREITRIFVSTTPGDFEEPATACVVQHKIGAECPATDIHLSCTGWLQGLEIATQYIKASDEQERILVLAGALMSRTIPARIIQHKAIFGDGAGGLLLETPDDDNSLIYGFQFKSLGRYADIINWPANWTLYPRPEVPKDFERFFYMGERYPSETKLLFRLAEIVLPPFIEELWQNTGLSIDDIDLAIIHQPTRPLFYKAIECLGIPFEKTIYNFPKYGNTVSAELPITWAEGIETGRIKRGDHILLITYGAGITVGGMVVRY